MKRDITSLLTGASLDELLVAHQQVEQLYREKASLHTEAFFAMGHDVFIAHVLEPLSRQLPFHAIAALRSVSRHWSRLLASVTHANFDNWLLTFTRYANLLAVFPHVTSLRANPRILKRIANREIGFGRITHLELVGRPALELGPFSADGWHSLQSLSFPGGYMVIEGIANLSRLTRLEVQCCAFGGIPDFSRMPLLRHLRIRGHISGKPFYPVPASLTQLDSYQARHFINYAGSGCLDMEFVSSIENHPVEHEARKTYCTEITSGIFTGEWVAGIFTGHAFFRFSHMCQYEGGFVAGKRSGTGRERLFTDDRAWTVYEGEWARGVKHGQGKFYTETRIDDRLVRTLLASGRWQNDNHIDEDTAQ